MDTDVAHTWEWLGSALLVSSAILIIFAFAFLWNGTPILLLQIGPQNNSASITTLMITQPTAVRDRTTPTDVVRHSDNLL